MKTAKELNKLRNDLRTNILETLDANIKRIRSLPDFHPFEHDVKIIEIGGNFSFPSNYDSDIMLTISGIKTTGKEIEIQIENDVPILVSVEGLEDYQLLHVIEQLENKQTMDDIEFAD